MIIDKSITVAACILISVVAALVTDVFKKLITSVLAKNIRPVLQNRHFVGCVVRNFHSDRLVFLGVTQ